MRTFKEDLEKAAAFHGHVCSGQCIGVKMAHMGMRMIGIDNETDGKKIMVFVECNRCPADSIMSTTGCHIGKRTYYFKDLGKVAATFLNTETGKAVRVSRIKHCYPPEGADITEFYDKLPDSEMFEAHEVTLRLNEGDYPGPPVCVEVCENCGEEVMDNRHVEKDGKKLCQSCAHGAYYDKAEA